MREHNGVLAQPASSLLADGNQDDAPKETAEFIAESTAEAERHVASALLRAARGEGDAGAGAPQRAAPAVAAPIAPAVAASLGPVGTPTGDASRLVSLGSRAVEIVGGAVLSANAAEASSARVDALGELRCAVVGRATELRAQADKKARMVKKKALVDLLRQLKASGLTHHMSVVDARQHHLADLCLTRAGSPHFCNDSALRDTWTAAWSRAEELYYRCAFKLTVLRDAKGRGAHADLSAREVRAMAGVAEHGFTLLLRARESIHVAGAISAVVVPACCCCA